MVEPSNYIALIVAAGKGLRAGGELPKQYCRYLDQPLLRHSAHAFASWPHCKQIYIAIGKGQETLARQALGDKLSARCNLVIGGDSRRQSVRAGLERIASDHPHLLPQIKVHIHDAARPGLSHKILDALAEALQRHPAAVPALPMVDSLARGENGLISGSVERAGLFRVQTPQSFDFVTIFKAHMDWRDGDEASDDARMVHVIGKKIAMVAGDERLKKITFAEDFI